MFGKLANLKCWRGVARDGFGRDGPTKSCLIRMLSNKISQT